MTFCGCSIVDESRQPGQYLNREQRDIYNHIARERKLELGIDSLKERWPLRVWQNFLEECKKHHNKGG